MTNRNLEVTDKNCAALQYIKLQKKANTFKSCIPRAIITEKQRNCSLNGSGETTLGKHSSNPGHRRSTEGADHNTEKGNGAQGTGLYGENKHWKIFGLVRTKGDTTANASGSCNLCS